MYEVGLPLGAEASHRDGRSVVEIVKQIFHVSLSKSE